MAESRYDVRAELLSYLMGKVEDDPYPSTTMMNTIEELLTPDEVPDYARLLMSKMADDKFPSVSMIDRIQHLQG
jgi:hypothetical protein